MQHGWLVDAALARFDVLVVAKLFQLIQPLNKR
jgi:hypothetical protein